MSMLVPTRAELLDGNFSRCHPRHYAFTNEVLGGAIRMNTTDYGILGIPKNRPSEAATRARGHCKGFGIAQRN
jgi:hypothetical protein